MPYNRITRVNCATSRSNVPLLPQGLVGAFQPAISWLALAGDPRLDDHIGR